MARIHLRIPLFLSRRRAAILKSVPSVIVLTIVLYVVFNVASSIGSRFDDVGEQSIKHDVEKEPGVDRVFVEPPPTNAKPREKQDNIRYVGDIAIVEDSIYWSQAVEDLIPTGVTDEDINKKNTLKNLSAKKLVQMSDDGRRWMAILSDDSQYIARQVNCELRSELLAFHLSQLMGMDSVPFATLSKINLNSGLWKGVQVEKKEKKPSSKRMPDPPTDGDIVSLTQWIEGLKKGPMLPGILLDRIYRAIGEPLFADDIYLEYLSKEEITQLVQWTDMILFDYINVNYDRSFPWLIIHGPSSQQPTNNVYRIGYGIEKLYFSNHAQTFVWSYAPFPSDPRIREHHDLMLHSSCIFRKSVADKIAEMNTHENPVKLLLDRVNAEEPLANITEPVPGCFVDDVKFGKILQKRLSEINTWITSCKDDYDRRKRQV